MNFVICSTLLLIVHSTSTIPIIEVYSISTTGSSQGLDRAAGPFGQSIVTAQTIAFDHINNNTSDVLTFPSYFLYLKQTEDVGQNQLKALRNAINIVKESNNHCDVSNNKTNITSPIVLCCPWSEFSVVTAPVFEEFGYCQISTTSSATSLASFSSFYRTMPSTEIAGKAYIPICKYYGWTRIGIVYIDDEYGSDLKDVIENEAKLQGIDAQSFSYRYSTNATTRSESLKQAAANIKELKLYITIVVAHSADLPGLLTDFKSYGILQYPYYYLFRMIPNYGQTELSDSAQGYMAVSPMHPALFTWEQYVEFNVYNGNKTIYDMSTKIYSQLGDSWKRIYETNPSLVYGAPEPHSYAAWGYDSAMSLALVLNHLIQSGVDLFDFNRTVVMQKINDYLTNSLQWIGASGLVQMDEVGNREHGYYAYGYINATGDFVPFGVYSKDDNITFAHKIEFPSYFIGKASEIPLSEPFKVVTIISVNSDLYRFVISLCVIFIVLILFFMAVIWKERKHKIIIKSSYQLNLIVCVGSIIGFMFISLLRINDFGCIITSYGFGIVFTLVFMPVFAKLYRLYYIINTSNIDHIMSAQFEIRLIWGIVIMCIIDIILFVSVTLGHFINNNIKSLIYEEGDEVQSETDALLITQNKYETCVTNRLKVALTVTVIIVIYKIIQFGCGLYFSLWTFRWKYNTPHNDEISLAILSVLLSLIIFVIMIMFSLIDTNKENVTEEYCVFTFLMMLIMIIMICGNVLPRLYLRYFGNFKKYNLSPEEIMVQFENEDDADDASSDEYHDTQLSFDNTHRSSNKQMGSTALSNETVQLQLQDDDDDDL